MADDDDFGLSSDPVLMSILKGLGGFLGGGLPGAFGGVISGIEGAEKSRREEETFREKLRAAQMENDQISGLYERGLADLEAMEAGDLASPITQEITSELSRAPDEFVDAAHDAARDDLPAPEAPDGPEGRVGTPGVFSDTLEEPVAESVEEDSTLDPTAVVTSSLAPALSSGLNSLYSSPKPTPAPTDTGKYLQERVTDPVTGKSKMARRFNPAIVATMDPDKILDHVMYTEVGGDPLKDDPAKWRTTFGNGIYDPKDKEYSPVDEMSLTELYEFQSKMLQHPDNGKTEATRAGPTSAAGGPQFTRTRLFGKDGKSGLVQKLGLPVDTIYNRDTQRMLAKASLEEIGLKDYREGKISEAEFLKRLRTEWQGAVVPSDYVPSQEVGAAPSGTAPGTTVDALIDQPVEQVKSYAQLVKDQQGDAPIAELGQLPPEQRVERVERERALWEEAAERVRQQADLQRSDPALSRVLGDEFQKADWWEKKAQRMVLIGTPQQQQIAVSMLNAANVKRTAALGVREAMNAGNVELMKSAERAFLQATKAGDSMNLATHKAGLAAQNKAVELRLRQINDLEKLDIGLEGRALLAEQKQTAERSLLEVKAARKDANEFPETIAQVKDQRDILGDMYYAKELASRLWPNQSGPIADWLPNFEEDVQELESVLNTINAPKIRKAFGSSMAVQESMIGLKGMGPSLKMDKGALLKALDQSIFSATQEYETLVSTKAPLFQDLGEPMPEIAPGSRYERFEAEYLLKLHRQNRTGLTEQPRRQSPSELRRRAAESVPLTPRPDFRRRQ